MTSVNYSSQLHLCKNGTMAGDSAFAGGVSPRRRMNPSGRFRGLHLVTSESVEAYKPIAPVQMEPKEEPSDWMESFRRFLLRLWS